MFQIALETAESSSEMPLTRLLRMRAEEKRDVGVSLP